MILYTEKLTPLLQPVPLIYEDVIPGRYLISPFGEVYSLVKNRIMRQDTNHGGYKRICLMTTSGPRNFSVHRLVAYTFIINLNPSIYTDVNHIDGDKGNNKYYNLEWCTNNQNKHHASVEGLYQHGEDRYNSVYTDSFAKEICEKFQAGIPYSEVYRYYQEVYPNTSSTIGSFVYKLYNRKTRNHITKLYKY
jgi:hypothetical protein